MHPTQIRWSAYHYARTVGMIHGEMMYLVLSDIEFQEVELRAILRQPELVPAPPEQAVHAVVIPEPEPPIVEDGPIDIPEAHAEDDDEELDPEEPEIDLEEPE